MNHLYHLIIEERLRRMFSTGPGLAPPHALTDDDLHTSHQAKHLHDFDLGCPVCGETWLEMTPPNYIGTGYATCTAGHRMPASIWRREQRLRNDKRPGYEKRVSNTRVKRETVSRDLGLPENEGFTGNPKQAPSPPLLAEGVYPFDAEIVDAGTKPTTDRWLTSLLFRYQAELLLKVWQGRLNPVTERQRQLRDWRAACRRGGELSRMKGLARFIMLLELHEAKRIRRERLAHDCINAIVHEGVRQAARYAEHWGRPWQFPRRQGKSVAAAVVQFLNAKRQQQARGDTSGDIDVVVASSVADKALMQRLMAGYGLPPLSGASTIDLDVLAHRERYIRVVKGAPKGRPIFRQPGLDAPVGLHGRALEAYDEAVEKEAQGDAHQPDRLPHTSDWLWQHHGQPERAQAHERIERTMDARDWRCTCPEDWQGLDHTSGCKLRAERRAQPERALAMEERPERCPTCGAHRDSEYARTTCGRYHTSNTCPMRSPPERVKAQVDADIASVEPLSFPNAFVMDNTVRHFSGIDHQRGAEHVAAEMGALAPGCCSAIYPCPWQQKHPHSICTICTEAAKLERQREGNYVHAAGNAWPKNDG